MMFRKSTVILTFMVLLMPVFGRDVEFGLSVNYRSINSSDVKDTYGAGVIFVPCLEVNLFEGLFIGASYDFGYKKDRKIGIKNEDSTFKIYGGEIFLTYRFGEGAFVPYIKGGAGRYTYKQDIHSAALKDKSISQSKTVFVIGGGFKYYLGKRFFLSGELRYSPFKVDGIGSSKPDIGGIKTGGGFGIVF